MSDRLKWIKRQIARSPHTKITGYLGELIILETMKNSGTWWVHQPRKRKVGDLHFHNIYTGEKIKVEVKTSRRNKSGRYQFCLRKNDKYGKTDCSYSDVVILLCIGDSGLITQFVVPRIQLGFDQKKCRIGSDPRGYEGVYAKYRYPLGNLDDWVSGTMQ